MYGGLASFRDLQIYMQQVVGAGDRNGLKMCTLCFIIVLGLSSCHHCSVDAHVWGCFLPFTLLSLSSVRSFCLVCHASLIATGLIMASYSTWRKLRHASRDKSVQAFPRFSYCKRQKLGMEAWDRGYTLDFIIVLGSSSCHHCSVDVLVCPATSM